MLTPELLQAVKSYTDNLTVNVTLALQSGEHEKRAELVKFLKDFCSVSDKLHFEERQNTLLRSPLSFFLEVDGIDTGVQLSLIHI